MTNNLRDELARVIPLTQGKLAIVDAAVFDWLSQWKWNYHNSGYAARTERINGKRQHILMHRQILDVENGKFCDHINGNRLDNRRFNLREATRQQNCQNMYRSGNYSSQYKGVIWHKNRGRWQAYICVDKKQCYLGLFDNEKEAALAYDSAAQKHYGEFARLNFPLISLSAWQEKGE